MEYVILGLLMMRECSLYDLQQAFKSGISLFYSASFGSIQRSVGKIVEKGWAEYRETVEKGRNKKIHRITHPGEEAFLGWMNSPLQGGSKLEAHALTKLYFLGLIKEDGQKGEILEDMIRVTEEGLNTLIAAKDEILVQHPGVEEHPEYKFPVKTLDYGIMSHSASLEWFKEEREKLLK